MKRILTYAYYRWMDNNGTVDNQEAKFISEYQKMVKAGYSEMITYSGKMNCTCGGADAFGEHYGFIIQADKETTKAILKMIDVDIMESFYEDTMEKLDKNLNGIEEWFWDIRNQIKRFRKTAEANA